jgi:hypothetical protein
MDDTKREWVRSWLVKAHSDLRSARALVALPEPATDTAIYHCQDHCAIVDVLQRVMRLLDPPPAPEPPRRQLGFHVKPEGGMEDKVSAKKNSRVGPFLSVRTR